MLRICVVFILLLWSQVQATEVPYLQNKFQQACPGDYIVTAHDNTYSLLRLRSLDKSTLILEEVSVPSSQVQEKTINWRKWIAEKAPGHTAWTLYEIDLQKGQLIECFSCSKNGWIYLDEQEQFFAKLLTLPFTPLADSQKKKIGLQPASDEGDHRKIWNPPLIIEGKKIHNPLFDILRTRWPDDSSQLALCDIDLYFDAVHSSFPFPYWIEVKSPHYAFKVRGIESGHDLASPVTKDMPRRPPEISKATEKTPAFWTIHLYAPLYHHAFHLFAIDLSSELRPPIAIPHRLQRGQKEEVALVIDTDDLKKLLQSNHRYQWAIQSDQTPSVFVKSDEIFSYEQGFPHQKPLANQ